MGNGHLLFWEIPRLCRRGRNGLTFSGVYITPFLILKAIYDHAYVHVLVDASVDGFFRAFELREGSFEGRTTVKPPALRRILTASEQWDFHNAWHIQL